VRENSPELKSSLNEYLRDHFHVSGSGATRRSQTYGIIHDRYYRDVRSIRGFQQESDRPDKSGRLSPWDEVVRRESEAAGLDWRLVTALMYQESRFDPQAVSSAGALGLMQVLPQWAGSQADSLFVPEANIRAGVRLLSDTFMSYAYLDSLTRLRFTLATYHAGYGHVTDARRLAMDQGRDPNRWEDSLDWSLERLMQRRYFSETRHGFYRGAITVAYVQSILDRYRTYMRLVPREGPPPGEMPLARGRDPDLGGESPSNLVGEVTEPSPPPE
jgi:membrane-bound lytic murein transglycosylase F